MGPILRLWFLHAKLRLYDQNYKYLWVPALICCFFRIHNRVIMTRINSLYWSQASPVVVCMQNNEINIRITSLHGSSLHLWFLHAKLRHYDQNYKSLLVPHLIYGFLHSKQSLYNQNCKSLWDPAHICGFVHSQQRHYDQN